MRCQTCRWWTPADDYNEIAHPLDPTNDYLPMAMPFEVRLCKSPKLLFYERPAIDGGTVVDGSQYKASLLTGPEFGCVNHEPEATKNGPEILEPE